MRETVGSSGITVDISSNENQGAQVGRADTSGYTPNKLQRFLKENLKQLGVAQIMIGVTFTFYGIIGIMVLHYTRLQISFYSFKIGFPIWAALSFIFSGSVTVVSAKKRTKALVWIRSEALPGLDKIYSPGVSEYKPQRVKLEMDLMVANDVDTEKWMPLGLIELRGNMRANTLSTTVSGTGILFLSNSLIKIIFLNCNRDICPSIKSAATGLVVILMILNCLQFSITLSLSVLTYNADGDKTDPVSEGPYQGLVPQLSFYKNLEKKDTVLYYNT